MRIVEVAPAGVHPTSGVTAVVARLAIEFAHRGHDVELWQLSPWEGEVMAHWLQRCESAGVQLRAAGEVADPNDEATDVVHLHNVFSPANNRLAKKLGVPYVVTPHGGYAPEQLRHHWLRKRVFRRLFELPMVRSAAHLVALTEVERDEIRRFCGRSAAIIPNGVDKLYPGDVDAVRRAVGIGAHRMLVYAGRIDLFHKRLEALVHGLTAAEEWHLVVMGGDKDHGRRSLEELGRELGVAGRLHLLEARAGAEYAAVLAAADVFGLMSRWEGQSMALLEALSLGVPAMVSPEVERRTRLSQSGAGWVASPAETGSVLQVISQLDRSDMNRFRHAARQYVEPNTWESVVGGYEELFSAVVAAR